jgi:RNA polymerase sigma-70 factor, ECF subfamily
VELPASRPDGVARDDRGLSFADLFEREYGYVHNTLRRLGVQARDVEDVVHDVFLAVHKRWDDYDRMRSVRPWLFAFAFRAASEYRRRARYRFEVLAEVEVGDGGPLADDRLARQDELAQVSAALDSLDFDRRVVLVAHDVDEHTMPEIASLLRISVNTAYSRLRLAREQFSRALARIRARRKTA